MLMSRRQVMSSEDTMPADVQAALANDGQAERIFASLSASHKREHLKWVLDAKKPQTRARRIEGLIKRLTKAM
jgi:uncharacterized protein YdeI (YjbR/CyaY-like superfamily)